MGITLAQVAWGWGAGCHLPEACCFSVAPRSPTSPCCFEAEETTAARQLPPSLFQNSRVAVTIPCESLPRPCWERTPAEQFPMGLERCPAAAFLLLLLGEWPAQ